MKKIAFLLAAGTLSLAASAQTMTLEPIVKPLDPALLQLGQSAPSAFEIRKLDLPGARMLLESTEGPAWRVLAVQASVCAPTVRPKDKSARQLCRELKADCLVADQFAHEHSKHAACSELYTRTTVLLTNDGPGKVNAKSAVKPSKVKPTHRPKATKRVSKPKASSC